MRVKARSLYFIASLVVILFLIGCKTEPEIPEPSDNLTTPEVKAGDVFLSSGFKIRSEIKIKGSVSTDPLIFEIYVDEDGNGTGLVGYKDNVYDVHLVSDQIYVVISQDVVVHIIDISGHMVPVDLNLVNSDLNLTGFSLLDGRVVSYIGGNSSVDMVSKYERSVSTFTAVSIEQSNNMTTGDLLKYFFESQSTVYTEPIETKPEDPERQSYYVNAAYGLTIRGKVYSIGDFCSPYTYFEDTVPQGMNEKIIYNQDKQVIFTYVTYISSDGGTMFMTTDGYVQAISTTSDFVFLGVLKRGLSKADLEELLGIGLKKEEAASFVPIRPGLVSVKSKTGYTLTLGDLTIELELGGPSNTLSSIIITNYLDFRS